MDIKYKRILLKLSGEAVKKRCFATKRLRKRRAR